MLKREREMEKHTLLKKEQYSTNFGVKVDNIQSIQISLDEIRMEKCEVEQELKNINMHREKLKMENDNLENLKREMLKVKKGEISKKIKLGAVAVEALIDPKGKMRKYKFDAEVERVNPGMKGDEVVDVVLKGTEQAVEETDQLLRELTSIYSVLLLKASQQSFLAAGEGFLLKLIIRRVGAAIGFKDGTLYIFGSERQRLDAKALVKQELKLCTSSPWRRWSFLRKHGERVVCSQVW